MTTVFEVRFTSPAEWIGEAEADAKRHAIQDDIVRIAVRQVDATLGQVYDKASGSAPGYDRRTPFFRAHFVEASYVSSRQQLVKLSAYCGVKDARLPRDAAPWSSIEALSDQPSDKARDITEATRQKVQETIRTLMTACKGLEVRTGALTVEEGAWIANSEEPIAAPPAEVCATCRQPIYFANEQWRHRATFGIMRGADRELTIDDFTVDGHSLAGVLIKDGRAEATEDQACPDCDGTGVTSRRGREGATCARCLGHKIIKGYKLNHLADPNIVERMV